MIEAGGPVRILLLKGKGPIGMGINVLIAGLSEALPFWLRFFLSYLHPIP
jgi:hypothetical protein